MIKLFEHHQYNEKEKDKSLKPEQIERLSVLEESFCIPFKHIRGEEKCLEINFN